MAINQKLAKHLLSQPRGVGSSNLLKECKFKSFQISIYWGENWPIEDRIRRLNSYILLNKHHLNAKSGHFKRVPMNNQILSA
jgi:hypothetical protein